MDKQTLMLPVDCEIIYVAKQDINICLWCEIIHPDDIHDLEPRVIHIFGTGHKFPMPREKLKYLGSVLDTPFVWHIYEEIIK